MLHSFMVGAPRMGDLVLEEASEPAKAEALGRGNGDDDVLAFASAITNLGAAARASVSGDDNDVSRAARAERSQALGEEPAKVFGGVARAVVEGEGSSATPTRRGPTRGSLGGGVALDG